MDDADPYDGAAAAIRMEDVRLCPEWWWPEDHHAAGATTARRDDDSSDGGLRSREVGCYDMSPFARAAERTRLLRRRGRSPYDRDADTWMRRHEDANPLLYVPPRGRTRRLLRTPPPIALLIPPATSAT